MDRRNSTQRGPVIILVICIVVISVIAIVIGTIPVNGFLWNVDHIDNIAVGPNESQTISGIKVYSEEDPVKIQVGSLVDAGAEFDVKNTSYDLENGQSANKSEVYIKHANSTDATIVVKPSALDSTNSFDVDVENINTTGVSRYNQNMEEINRDIEYITTQGGESDQTTFSVQTSANVSIKPESYDNETDTITFENINLANNSTDRIIIWKQSSQGELTEKIAAIQGRQESISIENSSVKGKENITVTIHPRWTNSTGTIYAADQATITAPISTRLLQEPIYYPKNNNLSQQYSESVYFEFNTKIRDDKGKIKISYLDGSASSITIQNQSDNITISDNELYLFLNSTEDIQTQRHIQKVGVDGVKSVYGGEEISKNISNTSRVSNLVTSTTNATVAQGTKIVLSSNESENIRLFSNNISINLSESADNNHNKIVDTSEIPIGEYTLESESETNGSQINITETSLSPKTPVTAESTGIIINFSSSSVDQHLAISAHNKSNKIISREVVKLEQNKSENTSIRVSTPGQYNLRIRDTHSGEIIKRSVQVLENRNSSLIFDSDPNGSYLGTEYDAEISSSYNRSELKIIDESNRTVATANLSTPDPGRTSVGVNTYALGNESLRNRLVTAGPGATVESVDTSVSNGTLSPGTYRIAVSSEQGLASTADETTVTVGNRSTDGVTAYATTALDRGDLGTADAVRRAIANGTLSPASTVASNETVVYAANATGLTGLPAARNATPETGADLSRLDGLAFGVRSNASTTEDETDADGAVPTNSSVHVDSTGLYLVAEGSDALATDETPADGETFTAEFRVEDERLREAASDAAGDHAVSTTVAFEAPPPDEEDEDTASDEPLGDGSGGGDGGDSSGGGSSGGSGSGGGGSSGGGSGGGGDSGGPGGGGASGGGTGAGGGATGGGSEPTGAAPGAGAAPSGSKAEKSNRKGGDRSRIGPGRNENRFGIRPVADVRPVASGDAIASPASASPTVAATNAGASPPEGDAASSEPGADRGDAGSDRAGGGNNGAEATETTGSNGADAESGVRDGPAAEPEPPDGEPETPSYDDAPIRTTADDVPGFGPLVTLVALFLTGRLAARRRSRGP